MKKSVSDRFLYSGDFFRFRFSVDFEAIVYVNSRSRFSVLRAFAIIQRAQLNSHTNKAVYKL